MSLYEDFSPYPQIVIGAALGFYSYAAYILLIKNKKYKKKLKESSLEALLNGLKIGSVDSLDDIYNIYKGVYNRDLDNSSYRPHVNKLLRELLVNIHSKQYIRYYDIKKEDAIEWKNKLDKFIKENEKLAPFSELPQAEKTIMNDLFSFLDKDDIDSAKRKVLELSNSIQIRVEQIERMEKRSKWSTPLGLVGLILTIIFGVASLR